MLRATHTWAIAACRSRGMPRYHSAGNWELSTGMRDDDRWRSRMTNEASQYSTAHLYTGSVPAHFCLKGQISSQSRIPWFVFPRIRINRRQTRQCTSAANVQARSRWPSFIACVDACTDKAYATRSSDASKERSGPLGRERRRGQTASKTISQGGREVRIEGDL